MKRIILTIILINFISSLQVFSADNSHKRLMEYAHPTPEKHPSFFSPALQSKSNIIPNFLNVITVTDEGDFSFQMQNESSIAVNPTNPSNIIASSVDYRDNSSTWVYVSDDGGYTWRNINLDKPFEGWRSTNDPSVAFNSDGIGYLVYGGFGDRTDSNGVSFGENGVFFAKSNDQGQTWDAHIPVILHKGKQTPDSTFEDKYYIEVDNSKDSPYFHDLYIPWKRVTPRDSATQIVISKSTDGGLSWSRPVPVSYRLPGTSEDTTYGQSFPLASTGPNGEVYVVWNHGIEHGVGFSKSLDGGETWSEPRIIQNYKIFGVTRFLEGQGYRHSVKAKVRAETYPVLITDVSDGENRGTLYLTWAGDRIPNIYFSKSTDNGDTWSEPVIVHQDTTNDQFWQWLSVDPTTGELAVMYFDSRNDPENLLVECYVSLSIDGGETWVDRQVADEGTDLRLNPFRGNSFAGDYSGLAFYDGILYPSWVDMRNASPNQLGDSDVFTAIVNTNAPEPANNFEINIIPENPEKLELSWLPPDKYSFGQDLSDEEYNLKLYRNDKFHTLLPGGTDFYSDTTVSPYEFYKYELFAIADEDSSMSRNDSSYAGGVANPDSPVISEITGNTDKNVNIDLYLPLKREDGVTPFVNLNSIKLYRDDKYVNTFDAQTSDTGKTVELIDIPDERGYYKYHATVTDKYKDITNESNPSNKEIIYTGKYHTDWEENFDDIPLPRYIKTGKWQTTDEIVYNGNNSLTVAPYDDYQPGQSDTLLLFPFEIAEDYEYYTISFYNAAVVYRNDKALVEVSFDGGDTWEEFASYKKDDYEYWDDGVLNSNDWKYEYIEVSLKEHYDAESMLVRFRFQSNALIEDTGWYIDRLKINSVLLSVNKDNEDDFQIYPNPARDIVTIRLNDIFYKNINDIKIYSLFGQQFDLKDKVIQITRNELKLDISTLSTGIYLIEIRDKNKIMKNKLNVIR